jgi:hypothetical protein
MRRPQIETESGKSEMTAPGDSATKKNDRKHTKESILTIPFPSTSEFELFAKDQERMIGHALPMMRLPLPLDPHDPDITCVKTAREISKNCQNTIDPEVYAEAFSEPDCDGRKEEG